MRLLLDENLSIVTARLLAEAGHDVESVAIVAMGAPDADVIALARAADRVLVTFDSDIGERLFHHGDPPPRGVLYLRFVPAHPEAVAHLLLDLLRTGEAGVIGQFVTVKRDRMRSQPLTPA